MRAHHGPPTTDQRQFRRMTLALALNPRTRRLQEEEMASTEDSKQPCLDPEPQPQSLSTGEGLVANSTSTELPVSGVEWS